MPRMTLLEVVQDVMSDTGLDEVNSIGDTVEALQVANLAKGAYYEVVAMSDVPKNYSFFQLQAAVPTAPTVMTIPDNITHMAQFEYDKKELLTDQSKYGSITYVEPAEFFRRSNRLDENAAEVDTISHPSGVVYRIMNDRSPSVYTVYNNKYVLCNAYNSNLETNLQESKTRCLGEIEPAWQVDDTYVIELDNQLMQLLLQKTKARALSRIKGERDIETERSARRLEIRTQTSKDKLRGGVKYPNYGR